MAPIQTLICNFSRVVHCSTRAEQQRFPLKIGHSCIIKFLCVTIYKFLMYFQLLGVLFALCLKLGCWDVVLEFRNDY